MSWASRRRFIILALLVAIAVAFFAIVTIAALYKTPSCSDGKQNQGEAGVDCGGPCPYLCTEEVRQSTVLFTKVIPSGAGRTDVIASIENVNATAAAKNVPYTVTLYGANQVFVQQVAGTIDLPPSAIVPVFIPGVSSGNQEGLHAFVVIDPAAPKWYRVAGDTRIKPVVTNTTIGGTADAPRVDAILSNASITALADVRVVVFVHDAQGDIIAASQTIVPTIPAQGQATATFTWNSAFSSVPATIEVLPVIPVPNGQTALR